MGFFTIERVDFIYKVFVVLGLVLPAISLLLGGIESLIPDIGFDLDGDGLFDGNFSFNFNSFLLSLVILGAIGSCLNKYMSLLVSFLISLVCAFISYKLLYKFVITPLKSNDAKAPKVDDFKNKIGTVKTQITNSQYGEVVLDSHIGKITYFAELNHTDFPDGETLKPGTKVLVIGVKDSRLIVTRYF